ncbi:CsgG/HfaB family protein [Caulobacter segnis]
MVAYDRSTREVKAGAAVSAVGASGAYITDLVTFSLRAVAVQTGEVLGQTTVTKSVNSLSVGGHITKIYSTSVLDLELGGAANEPVGLALQFGRAQRPHPAHRPRHPRWLVVMTAVQAEGCPGDPVIARRICFTIRRTQPWQGSPIDAP